MDELEKRTAQLQGQLARVTADLAQMRALLTQRTEELRQAEARFVNEVCLMADAPNLSRNPFLELASDGAVRCAKRGHPGSGLSSVSRIVSQHQGWIEVDTKLGVGTSINVFLPVSTMCSHGEP